MAYAALVSLMHIFEQILHPTRNFISLNKQQIEYLHKKVGILQDFLENYAQTRLKEIKELESRIKDAAYAAEDMIESHMVDQIREGFKSYGDKIFTVSPLDLLKTMEEMDSIEKELVQIKESKGLKEEQATNISRNNTLSRPPLSGKSRMVGFDKHLNQVMDLVTRNQSNRQVLSIVGMGGIGKTTLAQNIYVHPFIIQHFHVRAWVLVSQEYSEREILIDLVHNIAHENEQESLDNLVGFADELRQMSDDVIGDKLYKSLSGRRYLIVMDDVWSIQAWNEVKKFFPDNSNGSRIVITTRLLKVAIDVSSYSPYELDFLDEDRSWDLLCEKVFGGESFPVELNGIGKKIARSCKGLPLAIVVIGGLLAKSKKTCEYWEYVAEDVTSIVHAEDDRYCFKILSLSYNHLPIYIKPCFLYMGIFFEDFEICVSRLIKLWIAEGFLRPVRGKCLEEVAEDYLNELIDRNLIMVRAMGSRGKIKSCSFIHDLLRDLCLKQAEKEKFLCVTRVYTNDIPVGIESGRRLNIQRGTVEERYYPQIRDVLRKPLLARSLVCNFQLKSLWVPLPKLTVNFRLLRVLDVVNKYSENQILQLVNLRYISFAANSMEFTSGISLLWNLQTLIVSDILMENPLVLPSEIWMMPQLRHIEIKNVVLPDPPFDEIDRKVSVILENLQTLLTVKNFKCTEEILKRIPNIKKLKVTYYELDDFLAFKNTRASSYCLANLQHLQNLESLTCSLPYSGCMISLKDLAFPLSLKKLTLSCLCKLPWKYMTIVGSLPNLEVLKLRNSFDGIAWNTIEGQFGRLKFLLIERNEVIYWRTDNSHFPRLEQLVLRHVFLDAIPTCIGEIPTLRLIQLDYCGDSTVVSANKILEEQHDMGNEGLQVQVLFMQ